MSVCTRACMCMCCWECRAQDPWHIEQISLSLGHISCPLKEILDPYACNTILPCESASHEIAIFNYLWLIDNGDFVWFQLLKPYKTDGLCLYVNINMSFI